VVGRARRKYPYCLPNDKQTTESIPGSPRGSLLTFSTFTSVLSAEKRVLEAEAAQYFGGASKVADSTASGGYLVRLANYGESIKFAALPAAGKLAIRYASVGVGTISVAVNDQPARKVNVHSSGALTNSFLHSIVELAIPANATLTISLATNDVPIRVDRIVVGDGDLGLPPDIWNLPALKVGDGPYPADWKGLSQLYTVPEWWRDAKFGAWAKWEPQSMPEQGDWYARGVYQEGKRQYRYHTNHFGLASSAIIARFHGADQWHGVAGSGLSTIYENA
jgi:alpha-L-fucosidase-like protein